VTTIPDDRLLIETDSPYLAPVPYRGKRNEPAYVAKTLEVVAEARGTAPAALAGLLIANFDRLFAPAKLSPARTNGHDAR
jgi:TatD DNase family protein